MALITKIEKQKNSKRLSIYLDGVYGFGMGLEDFIKSKIKVGKHLSNKELEVLIQKTSYNNILDKLLRFCTIRPRSKKEVVDYLKRKKVPKSFEKRLFIRLNHLELLDDCKFTQWWIDQRITFRQDSKIAIQTELLQKGISKEIVEDVFAKSKYSETDSIKKLIKKK